jgi:hypothetical protein
MVETENTGEQQLKLPEHTRTLLGGRLRLSQVITTFGPGAVLDAPGESVMVVGLDNWPKPEGERIHDFRLEKSLEKVVFKSPALPSQNRDGGLPCVRFPRELICSGCGLFSWSKKCQACGKPAYPARLIVICPAGHADEFPWYWWAHRGEKCTGKARLKLEGRQKTAALADLVVKCETCGKGQPLSGALGPKALEGWKCAGKQPWLFGSQPVACHEKPRSVLRGATNVYFACTLSALSIPPWSDRIQLILDDHWQTLCNFPSTMLESAIETIPELRGYQKENVLLAIQRRASNTTMMGDLRREEYLAFGNPGTGFNQPVTDFQISPAEVPDMFRATIARVVLARRLREVVVLRGFTRLDPPDPENPAQVIAPIAANPPNWLPAAEHRGEGIFLELAEQRVREWERRSVVQERMGRLNLAYSAWREQRNMPPAPPVTARTVLLHTLAHLLMRQLSLECGYSSSALRERLYTGSDMCGLLIYTASSDSDGSLGGLVQQGQRDRFAQTMLALREYARWCSGDPHCTENNPARTGKLNGASCHMCSLVAETSCERGNRLLDRAFLMDLPGLPSGTGYFEQV